MTWALRSTASALISHPLTPSTENSPRSRRSINQEIYDIVLKAQRAAIAMIKPDIHFNKLQEESFRVILEGLIELGLLVGSVDDMLKNNVHYTFMPHSLGHYIGFKTHDVGFQRSIFNDEGALYTPEDYKKYDPITSAVIHPGVVTTVEPGIYFIQSLFDKVAANEKKKDFFNFEKIKEYVEVGGVRIEDMIWVKKDSYEVLTHVC